jgi:hypothetical protein
LGYRWWRSGQQNAKDCYGQRISAPLCEVPKGAQVFADSRTLLSSPLYAQFGVSNGSFSPVRGHTKHSGPREQQGKPVAIQEFLGQVNRLKLRGF